MNEKDKELIELLMRSDVDKDLEEELFLELCSQLPDFYGDIDQETFRWTAKVVLKLVRRMIWFYLDEAKKYTEERININNYREKQDLCEWLNKENPNMRY